MKNFANAANFEVRRFPEAIRPIKLIVRRKGADDFRFDFGDRVACSGDQVLDVLSSGCGREETKRSQLSCRGESVWLFPVDSVVRHGLA